MYTCDGEVSQLMLLVECKLPRDSSSNDLVKLANCLKDCMNEATTAGADDLNIEICGIVCEGTYSDTSGRCRWQKGMDKTSKNSRCGLGIRCKSICNGFTVPWHVQIQAFEYVLHSNGPYQL